MGQSADRAVVIRELWHKAIGVAFWLLMLTLWVLLARQGKASRDEILFSMQYVALVTGAVLAVTMWWIRHNKLIYRRKGPRTARPEMQPRTDVDRLDRPLAWHLPGGAAAAVHVAHLVIEIDGDMKTYRAA